MDEAIPQRANRQRQNSQPAERASRNSRTQPRSREEASSNAYIPLSSLSARYSSRAVSMAAPVASSSARSQINSNNHVCNGTGQRNDESNLRERLKRSSRSQLSSSASSSSSSSSTSLPIAGQYRSPPSFISLSDDEFEEYDLNAFQSHSGGNRKRETIIIDDTYDEEEELQRAIELSKIEAKKNSNNTSLVRIKFVNHIYLISLLITI